MNSNVKLSREEKAKILKVPNLLETMVNTEGWQWFRKDLERHIEEWTDSLLKTGDDVLRGQILAIKGMLKEVDRQANIKKRIGSSDELD